MLRCLSLGLLLSSARLGALFLCALERRVCFCLRPLFFLFCSLRCCLCCRDFCSQTLLFGSGILHCFPRCLHLRLLTLELLLLLLGPSLCVVVVVLQRVPQVLF